MTGLFTFFTPVAMAAECGGVDTSVIKCDKKGSCSDGTNPYEGVDPKENDTAKTSYFAQYDHAYGLCPGGIEPSRAVEDTGLWGVLLMAINLLTAGVGILAVAGIVYASIMYASAGGNADQTKKAMGIIANVVVGVLAFALMFTVLNFLIPGGLFKP